MGAESQGNPDAESLARFEREVRQDGRYPLEAFEFLHRGLEVATRLKHGDQEERGRRHVSGQELCQALRILALQRWGLLALVVLRHWNVRCTRDFGEMVYLMIGLDLMGKQNSDSITDFDDVYDFDEAFGNCQIQLDNEDV